MGLFFTLLYILVAFLTPPVLFGPASAFWHVEIILAVPTIFFSFVNLNGSRIGQMVQTFACFVMMAAVFFSIAFTGWLGGAPATLVAFLPNLFAFFFVALNLRTKKHMQMLALVLLFVSIFVIVNGLIVEHSGTVDKGADYVLIMQSDTGQTFYRLRGLGVIADPNDFGQFMMVTLPLMFLFWSKGQTGKNLFLVWVPVAILLYGIYLTHSRGALLALAVLCMIAFRKKIGVLPSVIAGGVMVAGLVAAGFTGGRDISAANGEDRMAAWDTGLQLIRSHPIFGVGYEHFTDYYPITAHNSVVVTAAEIGCFGFFFWMLFVVACVRDMYVLGESRLPSTEAEEKAKEKALPAGLRGFVPNAAPAYAYMTAGSAGGGRTAAAGPANVLPTTAAAERAPDAIPHHLRFNDAKGSGLDPQEIRRMANLVLLSLAGFFTTAWFLSRSFAMLFFIAGGLSVIVLRLALDDGMEVGPLPLPRAMKLTILPSIVLIAIVYAILRVNHLLGH